MSEDLRWVEPQPIAIPEDFRRAIGGHPLVAEMLYQRGYRTAEAARAFMDPDAYQPTSADELPDATIAYELITKALNNREKILVWGDFDVDGQTSTTVLVEGLRALGGDLIYHIPIRAEESHGITARVLQNYLEEGFDLLITCDTGITEHENIQKVRDAGIPVVLTDHHTLGGTLPPAAAVVNPQRLPEDHPLRTLPGVGVACKLIEGLFHYLDEPFEGGPYYELAALGIVADVAILKGDTRWLLQKGLRQLQHTERLGLQTLFTNARLNPERITETHIGFQIAPRLNAVGRLSDANPIVEFLTTDDPGRARVIGMTIEALNAKRRMMTRQVTQAAEKLLEDSPDDRRAPAIVLHYPEWPGGVVGIVANRLVERYHKPAILLTGKDPFHGSARSVDGINITQAISTQSHLLLSYGGHPMAAGMALLPGNFTAFKKGVASAVETQAREVERAAEIEIHQTLTLPEIDLDLIAEIERLAPFGPGNPPLNFLIRGLTFVSASEFGQIGEHRRVIASDGAATQQFLWWNGADKPLPAEAFDLVCQLSQSDYRGAAQISAEWINDRPARISGSKKAKQPLEVIDRRLNPVPLAALRETLAHESSVQVWAEQSPPEGFPVHSRQGLIPAETLVIWTSPPSHRVLNEALRVSAPQKVIVFGISPDLASPHQALKYIAGLAKFVLSNRNGEATLTELAAACALDREMVRTALLYWEGKGAFTVDLDEDSVRISAVRISAVQISAQKMEGDPEATEIYWEVFQNLWGETLAYRKFFQSAASESLFPRR
jgi:single-stranded-DNA-specific exonuclease